MDNWNDLTIRAQVVELLKGLPAPTKKEKAGRYADNYSAFLNDVCEYISHARKGSAPDYEVGCAPTYVGDRLVIDCNWTMKAAKELQGSLKKLGIIPSYTVGSKLGENTKREMPAIPLYPEHEKLKAIKDKSQFIGEFIERIGRNPGYHLCKHHQHTTDCFATPDGDEPICGYDDGQLFYIQVPMEKVLADFFGIDLKKIEEEKEQMLNELRNSNKVL